MRSIFEIPAKIANILINKLLINNFWEIKIKAGRKGPIFIDDSDDKPSKFSE